MTAINKHEVHEGSNPSTSTILFYGGDLGIDTHGIGKPRLIAWQSAETINATTASNDNYALSSMKMAA